MSEQGAAIEAVEIKTRDQKFTMAQLYKLAGRYYLGEGWVRETLRYCGRGWLAEQLRHNDSEDVLEGEGLPRKLYIENVLESELEELRYQCGLYFTGAIWLDLDEGSQKRISEYNKVLVVLQGDGSHCGAIIPPETVLQARRNETGGRLFPRPNTKKVEFSLHRWLKRGSFPRNVFFEGDDVKKEAGVPLKSPIGELCFRLSVHVEDIERTISNLVLETGDWYKMRFKAPHFVMGGAVPGDIRDRLLEQEYGIDEPLKAIKSA
jgi:hypothetical protein